MAYAKIPLKWDDLRAGYKFYDAPDIPEIKNQLKEWNDQVDKDNEKIKKQNEERAAENPPRPPLELKKKNTSCVMQLSLALNNTDDKVPANGAKLRQNHYLMGQYMILSVDELHDWLNWQYGRTEPVPKGDLSSIKTKRGILIMGSAHVELWDGTKWLQNMDPKFTSSPGAYPYWFWEVDDGSAAGNVLPDWLVGWWEVYNGQYYYYHFAGSGRVTYTKTKVLSRNAPAPKAPNNVGKAVMNETVHGPIVTWAKVGGVAESTVEKFTRLNWSSETDMNGNSNNGYAPLYARRRPD